MRSFPSEKGRGADTGGEEGEQYVWIWQQMYFDIRTALLWCHQVFISLTPASKSIISWHLSIGKRRKESGTKQEKCLDLTLTLKPKSNVIKLRLQNSIPIFCTSNCLFPIHYLPQLPPHLGGAPKPHAQPITDAFSSWWSWCRKSPHSTAQFHSVLNMSMLNKTVFLTGKLLELYLIPMYFYLHYLNICLLISQFRTDRC